jgi:hypothetical protein
MIGSLDESRALAAEDRLGAFDFGVPIGAHPAWVEDRRDALSCMLDLPMQQGSRHLTFRVVFQPASNRIRNVEVGEFLPLM